MSENITPVNTQGQGTATPTDSAPAENLVPSVQNAAESSATPSSAETVNTDNREAMIPRARFDQVNNKLRQLEAKATDLQAYEQFEAELQKDPELTQAIAEVIQKRKQASRPVETPLQPTNQPKSDPAVQQLAQQVFLMKAETNVQKYQSQCSDLLKQAQIPDYQVPMYKEAVERMVLQKLNGNLSVYDAGVVSQAVEDTKQYFSQFLNPPKAITPAPQVPVTKPNAPIEVRKFRTQADKIAYIANGLKASKGG